MTGQGKNAIDTLLAEALKEIATKQPIEKITIKEITDRAGVIRPTFYNHFQDKYELLEWIIKQDLLDPVYPLLQNGMITEAMVLLFSNVEKDKAFYNRAVRMDGVITFTDVAQKCLKETLLAIILEKVEGREHRRSWFTPEIIVSYYAQSMCFTMSEWVKAGMTIPPREMAEAYTYLITHSMDDMIKEL